MDRRTFIKITGIGSVAFVAGCTSETGKNLYAPVHVPDDMVPGMATWYASTCRECPAGCGVLAKNREGRVIKVEGNPLNPINQGKLCMRGQASVQGMYHPDRIKNPLLKENGMWRSIGFDRAQALIATKGDQAAAGGQGRVRMLSEVVGDSLLKLFSQALERWDSQGPLLYEPLAYETLKAANAEVLGTRGLPSYRMEAADLVVSFGADFLETWLSPVEYARKFKAMHAYREGKKGRFIHIGPHQSLTAANADMWLPCAPMGEFAVAMGLLRAVLENRQGAAAGGSLAAAAPIAGSYTPSEVARIAGVEQAAFQKVAAAVASTRRTLFLGTAAGQAGPNALAADMAANLLNLAVDPALSLIDFGTRHRVEAAASRREILDFFKNTDPQGTDLLLINNTNPAYSLPPGSGVATTLESDAIFTVCFTNFMDETAQLADLVVPVRHPLETWDEYAGWQGRPSSLQPAMGPLTAAPHLGDLMLNIAWPTDSPVPGYKVWLQQSLAAAGKIAGESGWLGYLQTGGQFDAPPADSPSPLPPSGDAVARVLNKAAPPPGEQLVMVSPPSIRFFDGRGADMPWLCEIPDPLTKIAWQSAALIHPDTLLKNGLRQGDIITVASADGTIEIAAYATESARRGVVVVAAGEGHSAMGRYAANRGANPWALLPPNVDPLSGAPQWGATPVSLKATGRRAELAHTDGSRFQHGRPIALSVPLEAAGKPKEIKAAEGLTMDDFPFTLPTAEGYDPKRDFYPPHDHTDYRWSMVVDVDRCIGCAACAAACYAENNIGVVGRKRVLEGREMSWMRVERYLDEAEPTRVTFLPMLCQHCDNAPCEPVCPVYAPHHSKEGLNNQIYNRCIGTRFCSQNCPYKVRRFNWFDWDRPAPLPLQLNPDVTVRAKGVMEKCSFCVQRIKAAHGVAKNENRMIKDGEITPACVQTCPTGALTFGTLMDAQSRARKLAEDSRAYQIMGYLNTKPAVIYLKKVLQEI